MEGRIKLIKRLKRIEGQIRGLQKMIEAGRDCEEIITLYASINGALKGAGFLIVKFYLNDCLNKNYGSIDKVEKDMEKIIKKYISSV